jgi:enediyne biosynthesis protein E5
MTQLRGISLSAATLQMQPPPTHAALVPPAPATRPPKDKRLAALRRFAVSISLFTLAGAFLLGFEDSWAQPVVALATAYPLDLLLETIEARANERSPKYTGGLRNLVNFLLPAHIAALSIALLLYPGALLMPIVFAVAIAIGSKYVLRIPIAGRSRHFMNPSNLGIVATLLAFPFVGVAAPYQFTENLSGLGDWALPAVILVAGTMLNMVLTGKAPLIMGWMLGLLAEVVGRVLLFGGPLFPPLLPLTGVLVVIFTNYMITDPGTTPTRWQAQAVFGAATGIIYGILVVFHVVFGLFFALAIVCALRGAGLAVVAYRPHIVRDLAGLWPSRSGATEPVRS